jgi:hypothetical protein
MTQQHRRTEVTRESREDGAESPPEVVGETLARVAQATGEKLGEECVSGRRSPKRRIRAETQARAALDANRPVRVPGRGRDRVHGKEKSVGLWFSRLARWTLVR